eukprot:TRINITY_DN36954_c0_g1_i1.p1 TRINITY_DN36954_c0_g1~~TRINITY_DN36954_c0_g1_i1.p1  ORF type:complete len:439 (-),score=128.26 TRINITY_DN36954_c0_g1_i1:147-1463(-)
MVQMWEIVGGSDKGGIIVRDGESTRSNQLDDRLVTGAVVEEVELKGERLHYRLAKGAGPGQGWVSIRMKGRDLAVEAYELCYSALASNRKDLSGSVTKAASLLQPSKLAAIGNGVDPSGGMQVLPPLPIGIFFPGQGSQYVKMLEKVKDLAAVKAMLKKAEPILGYDILDICVNGPEQKLEETRYCQPAMFIAGLAGLEQLRVQREEAVSRASVMAGLSLGEYTALCAAGVLSFEDGLKLVKLRGEAMQEAATSGSKKQLMCSIVGLERAQLEALCKEAASKEEGGVCAVANCLFSGGFSVGGTEQAMLAVKELAEESGALQVKFLKTAGAFHTCLMQPAQDKLSQALEEVLPNMQPPRHTVWMNATARPMRPGSDPQEIVSLLKRQLTNPVLWEDSVKAILKTGVSEFYEVGPSKQIKAMMKRINLEAWKSTSNIEV